MLENETLLGTYASWEIFTQNKAIKHCDKSVFSRLGSSVPKPTRWFWGIDGMQPNTRKKIILNYQSKDYQGTVNIYSNDLSQIYWYSDLKEAFGFIVNPESYPDLLFERIGLDHYKVSVLNTTGTDSLESVLISECISEGKRVQYYTTKYERNSTNRNEAIKIHGTRCMACGFDFEATYGEIGKNYIEVHHTKPLYSLEQETIVNPRTDLVCLCSNCHRMIHRKRDSILTLEELKEIIANNRIK
jgi:5-methylcytosine-specific restriction protein A